MLIRLYDATKAIVCFDNVNNIKLRRNFQSVNKNDCKNHFLVLMISKLLTPKCRRKCGGLLYISDGVFLSVADQNLSR